MQAHLLTGFIIGKRSVNCSESPNLEHDGEMKRTAVVRHLERHRAELIREGGRHTIYGRKGLLSAVPRHPEISDKLAKKICKELGIPFVR